MKKTILVFVAGIFMCLSSATNAATTTDAKDASAAKTEVKTSDEQTTYYVVGQTSTEYMLSTDPAQNDNCGLEGSIPCRFVSPDPNLGTSIDKDKVDAEQNDIEIQATRETLP